MGSISVNRDRQWEGQEALLHSANNMEAGQQVDDKPSMHPTVHMCTPCVAAFLHIFSNSLVSLRKMDPLFKNVERSGPLTVILHGPPITVLHGPLTILRDTLTVLNTQGPPSIYLVFLLGRVYACTPFPPIMYIIHSNGPFPHTHTLTLLATKLWGI
jgi:hypothetical protein